ncbi:hypothetical protein JQR84_24415 (plasmid) [Pseudomonas luteola]|uniref:hypothetical protein n=1 Tax=Pseudomonas TaxID=286 RepID=UPI003DA172CF
MPSSQKIRELCDSWCKAVQQPGGGMAIGGQSEQYRLLRNGVQFHDLCFDQLVAAVDGLTKVLLLPGLNTIVDQDHFGLWSWCAEVILYRETEFFSHDERELRSLFETCIRCSLAHCRKPISNRDEWEKQAEVEQQIPHNARYFLQESSLALAYLAFPLAEAVSKKICNAYIAMDGSVIAKFDIPNKFGKIREYDPSGHWNQRQCSSLRDLLFLIHKNIASNSLRRALDEFRDHIATLDNSEDPFDVIYKWRNQSLHGSTSFQTIGGTLLNLVILIVIHQLSDRYDSLKERTLERCRREVQHGHRSPWSFYPPY